MRESTTISAREAILARIDAALEPAAPQSNPQTEWEKLSRPYIRTDSMEGSAVVELFEDRLRDYGAHVFHTDSAGIPQTISRVLNERGSKRMLIPTGLPAEWLPKDLAFSEDLNLPFDRLDAFDGVITKATVAIAATGSIVLQHGPGEGRRALTLIPDYHLCVIFRSQVVQTVPVAFSKLDSTRPTTFISGPSATADIEMTRIKGVHGPRFLDMILVG